MNKKKNTSIIEDCITKALYKLIDKKPFDSISITEIVEKAGVSRISFYRHYDSKIDILNKELNKLSHEYINNYYVDVTIDNIETNLLSFFKIFYKYKELGEALYKSNTQYLIQQQFHKVIDKRLLNYNIYTRSFYTGGIYNCLLLWISTGFKETPEEIVNKILIILKTRI